MIDTITIILNWNKSYMTINLINQLLSIESSNTDILIVDNGSNSTEKEKLISYVNQKEGKILFESDLINLSKNKMKSEIYLLLLNKNYGYAKGNNFGLKLAAQLGYKYSLISNNDIKLEKPVIMNLIDRIKYKKDIAVIGPKIIDLNGKTQGPFEKPNIFGELLYPLLYPFLYLPKKTFHFIKYKILLKKSLLYPYRLMGCFMLMKTEIIKEVDYFDENTFLYAEELILAEKLKKNGYKMAYTNKVYVKHGHGISTASFSNKKRFFIQLKSDLYYYKKYRNYNDSKLFLVKCGRYIMFYLWKPMILKVKKLLSR